MRILTIVGLVIVLILSANFKLDGKPRLKNIIIISVDTLRADHLGCYGYPLNTSPHIDALAADGVRFDRCFTLTPLTAPALSTMLTSLPPHKHGAKRNGIGIYRDIKTFPYYLKRYGYSTAAVISNWPLRKKLAGLHREFHSYYQVFTKKRYHGILNSEGHAFVVNEKALGWLRKNGGKRFFLWVHYTEPHAPYLMHEKHRFDYREVDASIYPTGTRMKKIKRYDSEIAFTDRYIGQLIAKLKDMKLYDKSLIIFLSDHGESFGEHNYFKHGRKLYNSTMHVPFIVKLPGSNLKNTVRHDNVSLMDVAPTIFSILNMRAIPEMQGKAVLPDDPGSLNRKIYLETYKGTVLFKRKNKKYKLRIKPIRYAVVEGPWKTIYNPKNKSFEAYVIEDDPFESKNVYRAERETLTDLQSHLQDWIKRTNNYLKFNLKYRLRPTTISQQDFDMLKSLGYID
jgi:arylsulfatase A-like enzyme